MIIRDDIIQENLKLILRVTMISDLDLEQVKFQTIIYSLETF